MKTSQPPSLSLQRSSPHRRVSSSLSGVGGLPRGRSSSCRRFFCRTPRCRPKPQHEEGPDRLRGGSGIAPLIGHAAQDLFRDLAILPDRARRFENGQDGFKGVPMNPGDPLDLLGSGQGMAMHLLAGAVPILTDPVDVPLPDNARNGTQPLRQPRALPEPPSLAAREGRAEQEHLALPAGEEAPAPLAPLDVPVPDRRKDEQPEGQGLTRHAQTADLVVRQGGQGAE